MTNWAQLSPERFEQLCSEIIQSEGFYNIRRLGSTGDRGRDIIAQKEVQLMYGSKEVQSWVIQCKRYTSTNLTIDNISTELNKVRMHKFDYFLIIVSNTVLANVHDWLEEVKKQYSFKVLIFDIDWLEQQLKRQPLMYRRFFENYEPEIGTVYSYKNNADLQIYTAGKMPSEALRGSITWWRNDLEIAATSLGKKMGFYHPEFAGCDHSGINLSETVEQDFRMIYNSNLILAYLENEEQFGTMTEIMIGYSMNKQIAIFIDDSIQTKISCESETNDGEMANQKYYDEVYEKIFKTNHNCPCDLMNELEPVHLNSYWFMIEFLRLRQPDTFIQMTSKQTVIKDMTAYLKTYTK